MAIVTPATAQGDRRRYDLHSPVDGRSIGTLECDTDAEVAAAIAKARAAQPAWAALDATERAEYLRKALDALLDRMDHVVATIRRESGKPAFEALSIDVFASSQSASSFVTFALMIRSSVIKIASLIPPGLSSQTLGHKAQAHLWPSLRRSS